MATRTEKVPPLPEEVFGTTKPMYVHGPSEEEEAASEAMEAWLDVKYPRETKRGLHKRWRILVDLERLVNDWVHSVIPEQQGRMGARVLTFGSFRLGVINQSSDIDTLVMLPTQVPREKFFAEFPAVLRNREEVTECNAVPDARVPVVKVKYLDIYLDILAARVPDKYLDPQLDSLDDQLIYFVEEKCMKSMNGVRVADKILSLVPDPASFRTATRMIKFWAQQRCIYSNAIGYVGGVSWALMVGKVCQLYPYLTAKQIVDRFFYTYDSWNWKANTPVMLGPILDWKTPSFAVSKASQYKEWNPKYPSDKAQPMPIITPIFPTHNTAYNITHTQKDIIIQEIRRGKEILELMHLTRNMEGDGQVTWDDLCCPFPFFESFQRFLLLEIGAENETLLLKFKGLVESRIRALIKGLEDVGIMARPHTDFFRKDDVSGEFFLGLSAMESGDYDLAPIVQTFYQETMEKSLQNPEWTAIAGNQIALVIRSVTADQLSSHIEPKAKRMRVE